MRISMRVPYRYDGHCPGCGTRLLVLTPEPITDDLQYCSRCRESLGFGHQDLPVIGPALVDQAALPN